MAKGLIGVTGRAGAGKDAVSNIIKTDLRPNYVVYGFAYPLKRACCDLFDWTLEQIEDREFKEAIDPRWGFSPRVAMQRMGTEYGRSLREDLWVRKALITFQSPDVEGMIVTDVRFENEADFIRKNNGLLIHIERPGTIISESTHASEKGVEFMEGDARIHNNGTLDDLARKVHTVVNAYCWDK